MNTLTASTRRTGALTVNPEPRATGRTDVTADRIRRRAYEIFRKRNGGPGSELSDWLQAERELIAAAQGATLIAPQSERAGPTEASARARGESLLRSGETD